MSDPHISATLHQSGYCQPCNGGANIQGILQVEEESAGSPTGNAQLDVLSVSSDNQTLFSLTQIPNDAPAVQVYYNGVILLRNGANYSLSGTTLTILSVDWDIETGDTIHVAYTHD